MKKMVVLAAAFMATVCAAFASVSISGNSSRTFQKGGSGATISIVGSGVWTAVADVSWVTIKSG